MRGAEFAEHYPCYDNGNMPANQFVQDYNMGRVATSLTYRMLGTPNVAPMTLDESHSALESIEKTGNIWDTKAYKRYFLEGDYSRVAEGGIGNPTGALLNRAFTSIWTEIQQKIQDEGSVKDKLSEFALGSTTASLHLLGADLLYIRYQTILTKYGGNLSKYLLDNSREGGPKTNIEGAMTEFDVALILVDIASDLGCIAVPSPDSFEKKGVCESDFLFYNPATDQVAGIQTKTSGSESDRKKYEDTPLPVVLVTGMGDLESYRVDKDTGRIRPHAGAIIEACVRHCNGNSPKLKMNRQSQNRRPFDLYMRRLLNPRVKQSKQTLWNNHQRRKDIIKDKLAPHIF
jgi:hypothetical protein